MFHRYLLGCAQGYFLTCALQVDISRRAVILHSEAARLASISKTQDRQRIMADRCSAILPTSCQ